LPAAPHAVQEKPCPATHLDLEAARVAGQAAPHRDRLREPALDDLLDAERVERLVARGSGFFAASRPTKAASARASSLRGLSFEQEQAAARSTPTARAATTTASTTPPIAL
jgi:hypothetical protein